MLMFIEDEGETLCGDGVLRPLLAIIKRIMKLLWILGPILALISITISFAMLVIKAEEESSIKKYKKRLKTSTVSLFILFFVPLIISYVLSALGSSFQFTACWNNIDTLTLLDLSGGSYIPIEEAEKYNIFSEVEYNSGVDTDQSDSQCLEYSYLGNGTLPEKDFSSDTMRIVENHLNDFDATTFKSYFNGSASKFNDYVQNNLGGVFAKYYNKKIKRVRRASEFQEIVEYVYGFMTMYGVDYWNWTDYCKWGGNCNDLTLAADDAFYPAGMGLKQAPLFNDFDRMITQGGPMTTCCNYTVTLIYNRAGLDKKHRQKIESTYDFQIGDIIEYPGHENFICETSKENGTYTLCETGRGWTSTKHIKRTYKFGQNPLGNSNWEAYRPYQLEQNCK